MMRVALEGYRASASIDFVRVGRLHPNLGVFSDAGIQQAIRDCFQGRVELPRQTPRNLDDAWITLHDPTVRDLQQLVHELPDVFLTGLEVSLDFERIATGDSPDEEKVLFRQLKHSLAPQVHHNMQRLVRKQAQPTDDHRYHRIGVKTLDADMEPYTTVVWESPTGLQTRLYLRTTDNAGRVALPRPVVRLEVTFKNAGATQAAGIHRAGLLTDFLPHLRRELTPGLSVGRGLRPRERPPRLDRVKDPGLRVSRETEWRRKEARLAMAWCRSGASFGLEHGLAIEPDRDANHVIERAIQHLVDRLGRLQPPEKVSDYSAWTAHELDMYGLFPRGRPRSRRATAS